MSNHGRGGWRQSCLRSKIDLVRRPVTQRLMRPFIVIKLEIGEKMRPRCRDRLVVVKINLLVLDRPPEPLHKNVVVHPAAAIHAHSDPRIFQKSCEIHARELRTLIRVENLRLRDLERPPHRLQTEPRVQRDRKLPGNHLPDVGSQEEGRGGRGLNMDRSEIVVPGSNGEDNFLPGIHNKALKTLKRFAHGIGNNNCRWTGIMLDVHQRG